MKVTNGFQKVPNLSLALGFFDGVHKAHRKVISNAVKVACEKNVNSAVIIFKKHPREILMKKKPRTIVTLEDRLFMISKLGVDYAFLIDFDEELANVEPEDYIKNYLVEYFSPVAITTGYNHTFGRDAKGTAGLLRTYAEPYNYEYFGISPVLTNKGKTVSSSLIRKAVKNSKFELAKELAGYDFYTRGTIIHGKGLGRQIGYPTANFYWTKNTLRPKTGVYKVRVYYDKRIFDGVLNLGLKPTPENIILPTAEVFIRDFSENIYGKTIKVEFLSCLRDEKIFDGIEALKAQIAEDIKNGFGSL